MKILRKSILTVFRRPSVFLYMSIFMLIYCIIDYMNPIYSLIHLASIGGGDFFSSALVLLQMLNPGNLMKASLFLAGAIIAGSLLFSLFFSGYFHVVSNALGDKKEKNGGFAAGFKKNFTKVFTISLITTLLGTVFLVIIGIAVVPAITITSISIAQRPDLFFPAILLDIVTAIVVFFSIMFFRIYFLMWFPASVGHGKRAFRTGKRAGDTFFWPLVVRLFAFDIIFVVFIAFNFLFAEAKTGTSVVALIIFLINWIFTTVFFASLITFFFSVFKAHVKRSAS